MSRLKERPCAGTKAELDRRTPDSLPAEGRIVGAEHPGTRTALFGRGFSAPIAPGALSRLKSGMAAFAGILLALGLAFLAAFRRRREA